ncbi:MAG: SoxR reducing system RseC family protein [Bacteroidales bacterium]|jgi:sigma-E factor negative regulatory protein RseC|nr:SoxR reducing system RseC family protein [Bacteroidales bacterium]
MSDKNTIDHIGFVDSVSDQMAVIKINSQSACAACHAKGACSAADQEEKVLTVSTNGLRVSVGEQVRVLISKRTGLRAVAYGYIYPFLLIMIILISMTSLGMTELQAGLWSLISLVPYYLGIYLLRNKIGNSFTFKMEKIY